MFPEGSQTLTGLRAFRTSGGSAMSRWRRWLHRNCTPTSEVNVHIVKPADVDAMAAALRKLARQRGGTAP